MIGTWVSVLFAVIIICPFIVTFFTLFIFRKMGRAPASVLGPTADITTFILLLSVYIVSREIFGVGTGYTITTVLIVVTISYAIYERINVKEFRVGRLLKKVWRLLFLILVLSYIVLFILGIVLTIISYLQ